MTIWHCIEIWPLEVDQAEAEWSHALNILNKATKMKPVHRSSPFSSQICFFRVAGYRMGSYEEEEFEHEVNLNDFSLKFSLPQSSLRGLSQKWGTWFCFSAKTTVWLVKKRKEQLVREVTISEHGHQWLGSSSGNFKRSCWNLSSLQNGHISGPLRRLEWCLVLSGGN